jgi:hypothetical protein
MDWGTPEHMTLNCNILKILHLQCQYLISYLRSHKELSYFQASDLLLHELIPHDSLTKEQGNKKNAADGWTVEHSDQKTDKALNAALLKQDLYNVLLILQEMPMPLRSQKPWSPRKGIQEASDELMIATSALLALQSYWILAKLTPNPWSTKSQEKGSREDGNSFP